MIVLINSAHPILQYGLQTLCVENRDIELVSVNLGPEDFYQNISEFKPDVILYDIQSFQETVLETIKSIIEGFPSIKVIVITDATMDATTKCIVNQGVAGCISKEDGLKEIVEAIEMVCQGGIWVSKSINNRLNGSSKIIIEPELSTREKEVLTLISSGLSDKAISEELCISIRTAQYHVENIRQKLYVSNRTEAVIKAVSMKIIDVRDIRMN